jgi:tRNA A-37 threonylcarbamoyl transferase component Bud32
MSFVKRVTKREFDLTMAASAIGVGPEILNVTHDLRCNMFEMRMKLYPRIMDDILRQERLQYYEPLQVLVAKLHQANIYHDDIHPGNIVIDTDNSVRIIDYGMSRWDVSDDLTGVRGNNDRKELYRSIFNY